RVAATSVGSTTAGAQLSRGWPGGCPAHVVARFSTPNDFVAATEAIRSQVPRVYATLRSMGQPAWPHVEVVALINLGATPLGPGWLHRIDGFEYYRTSATHACGQATALRSLLAFLWFPECQIPCAPSFAFVTPTRRGWYLWTSYRV